MFKHFFCFIKKTFLVIKSSCYFQNKLNIFLFFTALFLNIVIWILLYFQIKPNPYPIPLHFTIYFGIDIIDKWSKIFSIPLLGLIFLCLNFILAALIFPQEKFLPYFLNAANILIQILLVFGVITLLLIQ